MSKALPSAATTMQVNREHAQRGITVEEGWGCWCGGWK